MKELQGGNWDVRGLYSSRASEHLVKCDLMQLEQIEQQFTEFAPDAVIHAAAERRPDVVFKQPNVARSLNIDVTLNLANACHNHKTWMIFMSTDYIFDGEKPPYAVDAIPNPLSTYGEQKVAGEGICSEKCPNSAVLRVPLLYGPIEYLKESGVTAMYMELEKGIQKADHVQKRYPTYTPDVARIIKKMLEVHFAGKPLGGIFHWQGNECLTKYDMVQTIASIMEVDASKIEASKAKSKFPVPPDSRLDCSKLEKMLDIAAADFRTPFRESLEYCLKTFMHLDVSPPSPKLLHRKISKAHAQQLLQDMGAHHRLSATLDKMDKDGDISHSDLEALLHSQMSDHLEALIDTNSNESQCSWA